MDLIKHMVMKIFYCNQVLLIMLVVIFFYSCQTKDVNIAKNLYNQREYLLKEFKDKSIINRGKIFYQLSYYKGQFVNTFFFDKKDNALIFTNDTLQYPVNEIAAFSSVNITDSLNYHKALIEELNRLLNIMNNLKVDNITADFVSAGVDMKIYFGDYRALLYVQHPENIKNERWKNYINRGEKFDNNWYYVKDELEK